MKRLFQSAEPTEGSVYRNLTCTGTQGSNSSSSGPEDPYIDCLACLGSPIVSVISGPGCADFPVTDNNYGAIPQTYSSDVEIDPNPFDAAFDSLSSDIPDPVFTDLWGKLSPAHQATVLVPDCYCPGTGITKPGLVIGRPQFPRINPLPFFWIPAGGVGGGGDGLIEEVRKINLAIQLPADCCDDEPERIEAIVTPAGVLELTPFLKPDLPHEYRADDAHTTFQLRAGYPRYCCIENDCAEGSLEGNAPDFALRYLHFPRWPGVNTHDPYGESNQQEPMAMIPVIVDIQCDEETGLAYIYRANVVVHDGIIALVQWDADPPRSSLFDPTEPPLDPLLLDVNYDYQGREIFDAAQFDNPVGELCEDNCIEAAANIGKMGCIPSCPTDGAVCNVGHTGVVSTGAGLTEMSAITSAFAASTIDVGLLGCTPESTTLCYSVEVDAGWEAAVKACCPI